MSLFAAVSSARRSPARACPCSALQRRWPTCSATVERWAMRLPSRDYAGRCGGARPRPRRSGARPRAAGVWGHDGALHHRADQRCLTNRPRNIGASVHLLRRRSAPECVDRRHPSIRFSARSPDSSATPQPGRRPAACRPRPGSRWRRQGLCRLQQASTRTGCLSPRWQAFRQPTPNSAAPDAD